MPRLPEIDEWLEANSVRPSPNYEHLFARERNGGRAIAFDALQTLVTAAHADARNRLIALAGPSLDPLAGHEEDDAAIGYPEALTLTTLKGYFGKFFSAVVAENFDPFGFDDWFVPVLRFRKATILFSQ